MKTLALFLILSSFAQAQNPAPPDVIDPSPGKARVQQLRQTGSLFSINVEPKRPVEIQIVGNEVATFDLSSLKLTVFKVSPKGGKEVLHLSQQGNRFVIQEPLDNKTPVHLEVKAKTSKKTETFKFKVPPPP